MELHDFTDLNRVSDVAPYVAALESFDAIPELQELKVLARSRSRIGPGTKLLDVGCGFVLESLKLAHLVDPGVVDGGLVVDVGAASDGEIGFLEERQGGLLEGTLGKHQLEHGQEP